MAVAVQVDKGLARHRSPRSRRVCGWAAALRGR
jgi:hypothetical protein